MILENVSDKYKRLSLVGKASIWFIICNILLKGISVISVPIFTRLLSTEEYGTYSLYNSWFNILTIFTSLNLYFGVFNNAMNRLKTSKEKDSFVSSMQGLTTSLSAIAGIIIIPFRTYWSGIFGLSEAALCLMIVHLWIEPAVQFYLSRQRFEFKYKHAVIITLTKSMLNPILGVLLVVTANYDKAIARILSVVLAEVFVAGTILIIQFKRGRVFYSKENWKYALSFNLPLLPHYLSSVVLGQADRIMIQRYAGLDKVGVYSVAYNIGLMVQLFTNAINSSLTPWTYEKINKNDCKAVQRYTNILLILLSAAICAMLLFVPEIVAIFGGKEYTEAIYVVPPVSCSVYFIFLYNIFAIPQMYFERQKFMSISSTAVALLNIVLNYIFINEFGYIAAGYTTVICYLIYSLGHYLFTRKVLRENAKNMKLYDEKIILAVSLFVLVCSVGFNYLYKVAFLRYSIFTFICVIAYLNKNRIITVYKTITEK